MRARTRQPERKQQHGSTPAHALARSPRNVTANALPQPRTTHHMRANRVRRGGGVFTGCAAVAVHRADLDLATCTHRRPPICIAHFINLVRVHSSRSRPMHTLRFRAGAGARHADCTVDRRRPPQPSTRAHTHARTHLQLHRYTYTRTHVHAHVNTHTQPYRHTDVYGGHVVSCRRTAWAVPPSVCLRGTGNCRQASGLCTMEAWRIPIFLRGPQGALLQGAPRAFPARHRVRASFYHPRRGREANLPCALVVSGVRVRARGQTNDRRRSVARRTAHTHTQRTDSTGHVTPHRHNNMALVHFRNTFKKQRKQKKT